MENIYVISLDIGSAEARAALITGKGEIKKTAKEKITNWSPQPGYYQQSSKNIWQTSVNIVQKVISGINPTQIKGIGCDATCSLVVVGRDEFISVCPEGGKDQDIIMWMDHRAREEADLINSTGHRLLSQVGGKISLEMQLPKLLWLKRHLPLVYESALSFFDLPDYLVYKLTGVDTRSACCVVCKWMYESGPEIKEGWNQAFFDKINLGDLLDNCASRIGKTIACVGSAVGNGLSNEAAEQLGLIPGTPVSTALIDAHAGGLALVSSSLPEAIGENCSVTGRLGLICGTSTCTMLVSWNGPAVGGVWGPYYGAMLPQLWLHEGGQSATGHLVDFIIESHPSFSELTAQCNGRRPTELLNEHLISLSDDGIVDMLAKEIHVYPDFRGNRSPLADPSFRGMISGLDMSDNLDQLALIYLATIQALCYGTRQIIERLEESGCGPIQVILACGGLSNNKLFVDTISNSCMRPIAVPLERESVLLGGGIIAASAAQLYESVHDAAKSMASPATMVMPSKDCRVTRYHEKKYCVFKKMQQDQLEYRSMMS